MLGWELPRGRGHELDGHALDGRDPLAEGASAGVYFESYFGTKSFGWSPLAGWTDGRAKYVHSGAPELFDLAADPGETHSVLGARADEAARLGAHIAALLVLPRLARTPLDSGQESLQREIERLGYAGADAPAAEAELEPLAAFSSPSPHRMSAAYADYMAGRKLFEEKGSREAASALLERAVGVNPENHKAWFTLGLARQDLGRFDAAADAFQRVLALPGGERIPAQLDLGVCLYNLGRPAEALRELESALAETPGPPGALELLIRLLDEAGRADDAARTRLRLTSRGQP
ncbi:MAG: tetratricopeptide repeat protein [Planctomycetes bacterium]|nr:tetratricopeptide repeat protein [Planctomycetota bacterium]